MNFTQLRAFYDVALAGSFSQAAENTHQTQPGLSAHVRALEEIYQVELFYRAARGVRLTPQGRDVFVIAEKIFRLSQDIESMLLDEATTSVPLRIISDNAARAVTALAALKGAYPEQTFALHVASGKQVLSSIKDCSADIGLITTTVKPQSVYSIQLGAQPIDLVVAREHPLALSPKCSLQSLRDYVLLAREQGSRTRARVDAVARENQAALEYEMEISGVDALREAIARGLGVGFICRDEYQEDSRLCGITLLDAGLELSCFAICSNDRKKLPRIRGALSSIEARQ